MLEISLTGNRLSGKTMVASKFEEIGVPVFDADIILKFILNHKFYFYTTLKKSLGYSPFDKNGNIDPDKILNDLDFNKVIDEVESDLMSAYDRFKRAQKRPYVIFKSSLIFERGWDKKI
jgi:dephospho-CoA kinase